MKIAFKRYTDDNTDQIKFWEVVYELRLLNIEEVYDSFSDRYYEEGPEDVCEYLLIKYPDWLCRYYDRYG